MSKIGLTTAIRSNLLSLQQISGQVSTTQNILSTGKKVNSAIDNPSLYYTAQSLTQRPTDLTNLLDAMGQAVSTIKAATEGIDAAANILTQMQAVTSQTIAEAKIVPLQNQCQLEDNAAELIAQGYTAINASMSASEIQAILNTDNAKVVLTEDITLNTTHFSVRGKNVTINGGGHKLTNRGLYFSGGGSVENLQMETTWGTGLSYGCSIYSEGGALSVKNVDITFGNVYQRGVGIDLRSGGSIENVNINLIGDDTTTELAGIWSWDTTTIKNVSTNFTDGGNDDIYMAAVGSFSANTTVEKITVSGTGEHLYGVIGQVKGVETTTVGKGLKPGALYNGKANTEAILKQLGSMGTAASAANQFYVGDKDGEFGQGNWYLPGIGELMDMYGYDYDKINAGYSTSGAVGDNKNAINTALSKLKALGIEAETLTNSYYWSSSECNDSISWPLTMSSGGCANFGKDGTLYVRCFQQLENIYDEKQANKPKIGNVMYDDKTWGSADNLDTSKTVVGVVVSAENGDVKIMNLKDLTFNSQTSENNFDPDDPYGGAYNTTRWSTGSKMYENVQDIEDYPDFRLALELGTNVPVVTARDLNLAFGVLDADDYAAQYNELQNQYDSLINDSSYKGINLLKNDTLKVRFNEEGSSKLNLSGKDMRSSSLGLSLADWAEKEGLVKSVNELAAAVAALRDYQTELGSNFNIITTRQDFTENLINVLEEGADKLTLADMNEESANMLALQTRQQLAINSLSLASQANQSILKLF